MKKPHPLKSPRKVPYQSLGVISAEKAETLLYDWVNLPLHPKNRKDLGKRSPEYDRMLTRYPDIFCFSTDWKAQYDVLTTVWQVLRDIWDTPDARRRDWLTFEVRAFYERCWTQARDPIRHRVRGLFADVGVFGCVPKITPFEAAMFHLQTRLTHRMLHCPNPECAAPYFFRAKKGQKFCSPECADPSRREQKRRWHRENRGKGV